MGFTAHGKRDPDNGRHLEEARCNDDRLGKTFEISVRRNLSWRNSWCGGNELVSQDPALISLFGGLTMAADNNYGRSNTRLGNIESLEKRELFAADLGFGDVAISGGIAEFRSLDETELSRAIIEKGCGDCVSKEGISDARESRDAEPSLPGDVDGNGEVAFNDFLILSKNFGQKVDHAFADGDIDGDGQVGFADFLALSQNFGSTAEMGSGSSPVFGIRKGGQLFVVDNATGAAVDVLSANPLTSQMQADSLVVDPSGNSVFGVNANGNVIQATRDPSNVWTVQEIAVPGGVRPGSLIATGDTNPIYGVRNSGQLGVIWMSPTGLAWGDIVPAGDPLSTSNFAAGIFPDVDLLVMDPNDHSVFGVEATAGHVVHVYYANGQWHSNTISVPGGAWELRATGDPNPIYGVSSTGQLGIIWDNGNALVWGDILPVDPLTADIQTDSLVLDPTDQSIYGVNSSGNLIHASWEANGWKVTETQVPGRLKSTSLVIDSNRTTAPAGRHPFYGVDHNGQIGAFVWNGTKLEWTGLPTDWKYPAGTSDDSLTIGDDGSIFVVEPNSCDLQRIYWDSRLNLWLTEKIDSGIQTLTD